MTQVNLLPRETRERQTARRQTMIAALVGLAVVAIVVFLYFMQSLTLSDVNDQIAQQQQQNAQLEQRAAKLQRFEELRNRLQERRSLVGEAMTGEIAWSVVLQDLSRVIPSRVWLANLTASLAGAQGAAAGEETTTTTTATAGTTAGSGLAGSLTFDGSSLDTDSLSQWLTRLEQVRGWVNAWMSKAQKTVAGSKTTYTFSSSVDLTSDVVTGRGSGRP